MVSSRSSCWWIMWFLTLWARRDHATFLSARPSMKLFPSFDVKIVLFFLASRQATEIMTTHTHADTQTHVCLPSPPQLNSSRNPKADAWFHHAQFPPPRDPSIYPWDGSCTPRKKQTHTTTSLVPTTIITHAPKATTRRAAVVGGTMPPRYLVGSPNERTFSCHTFTRTQQKKRHLHVILKTAYTHRHDASDTKSHPSDTKSHRRRKKASHPIRLRILYNPFSCSALKYSLGTQYTTNKQ